ncbi:hypothetical protein PSM36_0407 [Proteiniphilum saccharofermentans]|uniref:Uncharacterized protein n=1 Tax=Proteiniphilum saccharofermentans TaxID=1642647 RepID=A0A1R3SWA6_9BACT|nr:hypothetical protein PSM36_0407 [Proteiniphilum saccharofermentans]
MHPLIYNKNKFLQVPLRQLTERNDTSHSKYFKPNRKMDFVRLLLHFLYIHYGE